MHHSAIDTEEDFEFSQRHPGVTYWGLRGLFGDTINMVNIASVNISLLDSTKPLPGQVPTLSSNVFNDIWDNIRNLYMKNILNPTTVRCLEHLESLLFDVCNSIIHTQ